MMALYQGECAVSLLGVGLRDQRCLVVGGLLCCLNQTLNRVHQRQLLPALLPFSHMGVDELGFILGQVVFQPCQKGGPGGAGQ